jgi:hypothetical protein
MEVHEYVNNENMVRRLIDDYGVAVEATRTISSELHLLQEEHDRLKEEHIKLLAKSESDRDKLNSALNHMRGAPFLSVSIALAGNLAVGIGVNMVTADRTDRIGFWIIALGAVLSLLTYFVQKRQ